MNIGLREWLIIGGILLIGLIIFDGWRRMKGQRSTLKIDIDRSLSESEENTSSSDARNPELPNGGARAQAKNDQSYSAETVDQYATNRVNTATRIDPGFEHLNDYRQTTSPDQSSLDVPNKKTEKKLFTEEEPSKKEFSSTPEKIISENAEYQGNEAAELDPLFDDIPEILSPVRRVVAIDEAEMQSEQPTELYDLEQPITVLMRQTSEKENEAALSTFYSKPFKIRAEEVDAEIENIKSHETPIADKGFLAEALTETDAISVADVLDTSQPEASQIITDIANKTVNEVDSLTDSLPESEKAVEEHLSEQDASFESDISFEKDRLEHARSDRKAREHAPEPEAVLIITVAGKQQPLDGHSLLQVVLACGMRFGDMSLFHRFEEDIDEGAVQFSMANAVNPGTFDLEQMDDMTTPGVTFFMSMNEPDDVKNAFECMLATAETVSKHLGGDLLDENRSVMGAQTKAHYRERIREYELHTRRLRKEPS